MYNIEGSLFIINLIDRVKELEKENKKLLANQKT